MKANFARRIDKYAKKLLKAGKGGQKMKGTDMSVAQYLRGKKLNERYIRDAKRKVVSLGKQRKKIDRLKQVSRTNPDPYLRLSEKKIARYLGDKNKKELKAARKSGRKARIRGANKFAPRLTA